MIDLTPLEVRKKKGDFKRAMRGYDPQLVDDFLDLVADRLEELARENQALREQSGGLEQRVTEYREREKALTEALVSAQELREEARAQAVREAELRMREAEADAERIRSEAYQERERQEDAIRRLRARRVQLLESFRAFLEREMGDLSREAAALELESTKPRARPGQAAGASPEQARGVFSILDGEDESPLPPPELAAAEIAAEEEIASGPGAADESPDWLSRLLEEEP